MITIKFNQISLDEITRQYEDGKELDILVSSKITDRMYFVKSRDIMYDYETYRKNVESGWYRLYIKVFEGREICTDDMDLQDELDMIDDGILNYGEEQ